MLHDEKQYLLDIKIPISFQEEDYIVTNSNYLAWALVKKWPKWCDGAFGNVAYLFGEHGSGKSHLSSIWKEKAGACLVTKDFLCNKNYPKSHYLIDGIESFLLYEKELFYFINHIFETKMSLLITSSVQTCMLDIKLQDLRSRARGVISVEIAKPDDMLVSSIIIKYFSDSQIAINIAVIKYLVMRIDRSYAAIKNTLEILDKISLEEKRKISVPFIKEVFGKTLS